MELVVDAKATSIMIHRVCTYLKIHRIMYCSHVQSMEVDEDPYQILRPLPSLD